MAQWRFGWSSTPSNQKTVSSQMRSESRYTLYVVCILMRRHGVRGGRRMEALVFALDLILACTVILCC